MDMMLCVPSGRYLASEPRPRLRKGIRLKYHKTPPQTQVLKSRNRPPPPRPSHNHSLPPFFFFRTMGPLDGSSRLAKAFSGAPRRGERSRGHSSSLSPLEGLPDGLSYSSSSRGAGAWRPRGRSAISSPSRRRGAGRSPSSGTEMTAWHLGHLIRLPAKRSSMVSCLSHSRQATLMGMTSFP